MRNSLALTTLLALSTANCGGQQSELRRRLDASQSTEAKTEEAYIVFWAQKDFGERANSVVGRDGILGSIAMDIWRDYAKTKERDPFPELTHRESYLRQKQILAENRPRLLHEGYENRRLVHSAHFDNRQGDVRFGTCVRAKDFLVFGDNSQVGEAPLNGTLVKEATDPAVSALLEYVGRRLFRGEGEELAPPKQVQVYSHDQYAVLIDSVSGTQRVVPVPTGENLFAIRGYIQPNVVVGACAISEGPLPNISKTLMHDVATNAEANEHVLNAEIDLITWAQNVARAKSEGENVCQDESRKNGKRLCKQLMRTTTEQICLQPSDTVKSGSPEYWSRVDTCLQQVFKGSNDCNRMVGDQFSHCVKEQ